MNGSIRPQAMLSIPTTWTKRVVSRLKCPTSDVISRWKVSTTVEPPLDCEVLEKPCTIVLVEDQELYKDSWVEPLRLSLPNDHGISFTSITYSKASRLDDVLEEMKSDLPSISDAVLVSRGPLVSWCAQFYLESFPLQGLVMVDPILFDNSETEQTIRLLGMLHSQLETLDGVGMKTHLLEDCQSRKLKLEPNSVPMLVMHSLNDEASKCCSIETAKRHSDINGLFGAVPVEDISQNRSIGDIINKLDNWVDSIL